MKNSIIVCIGLFVLGLCMVISSIIFSNGIVDCINKIYKTNHIITGSLDIDQKAPDTQLDNMAIGEVSRFFGYDDIEVFSKDLLNGRLGNIPYINIKGHLIFSRTALNDWLVESAKSQK